MTTASRRMAFTPLSLLGAAMVASFSVGPAPLPSPAGAASGQPSSTSGPEDSEPIPSPTWCAPELEVLAGEVCSFDPPGKPTDTVVVFLHGVIKPNLDWQHAQQRAIARAAAVNRFATLMPRGRRGIGPKGMWDWWTWPTSVKAQQRVEDELIEEWRVALAELERAHGSAFERTFVFGFSNGAYYGSSLLWRGRLDWVDGYGVFAGGSGAAYLTRYAKHVPHRPPVYVGYGQRDPAGKDSQSMARELKRHGWPHELVGRRGVGHTMTDAQLREAFRYLTAHQ